MQSDARRLRRARVYGELVVVDDVPGGVRRARHRGVPRPPQRRLLARPLRRRRPPAAATSAWPTTPAAQIDWWKVDVYWGDERCVPLDHEDSNYRLVREALLDRVGRGQRHLPDALRGRARPPTSCASASSAARRASTSASAPTATPPRCSPARRPDADPGRLVVMNEDPSGRNPHPRMTLTFAGIARARLALVTVAGEEKREALARVVAGDEPCRPAASGPTGWSGSSTRRPRARRAEGHTVAVVRGALCRLGVTRPRRTALQQTAVGVQRSVRRRLVFANAAGALAVLTFVRLASGDDLAPHMPLWLQIVGPLVPVLLLVAPAYKWGHRAYTRTIGWAMEGREPTRAERFAVLREPWRQALRPLLFWVIGAACYGAAAAAFGADVITVVRVVEGTVIGSVTTCALAYLMIERSFRPAIRWGSWATSRSRGPARRASGSASC